MISETTRSVIDQAKCIYNAQKKAWEASHNGEYVSIEPESGEYFFAASFDAAVRAARTKYPERLSHTVRVGHDAVFFIGFMES
jgi:hypothetical protein